MKQNKTKITSAAVATAALLLAMTAACDNTAEGVAEDTREAKREVDQAVQEAKYAAGESAKGAQQELRDFKRSANAELIKLDAKLEQLKDRSAEASTAAKQKAEAALKDLTQKRQELGQRIETLEIDARNKWEDTKAKFDADLASLGRETDKALDALGDEVEEATR
jgi:predicted small secreted protein